jgi:hypothetical protein
MMAVESRSLVPFGNNMKTDQNLGGLPSVMNCGGVGLGILLTNGLDPLVSMAWQRCGKRRRASTRCSDKRVCC